MSALSRRGVPRATAVTAASSVLALAPAAVLASDLSDTMLAAPALVRAATRVVEETGAALVAASLCTSPSEPPIGHPKRPSYDAAQKAFDDACDSHFALWRQIERMTPTTIRGAAAKAEAVRLMLRNWHDADEHEKFDVNVMDEPARLAWSLAEDIRRLALTV